MIRASVAEGRYVAGEQDIIAGGLKSWTGEQTRGVVMCHGSGQLSADLWTQMQPHIAALAPHATVHVGDLAGQTWCGELVVDRIGEAIAVLRDMGVTGPVALIGASMGAGSALNYALRHPEDVACVAALIPLTDMGFARANPYLSARWAEMDAAYDTTLESFDWTGAALESTSEKRDQFGGLLTTNESIRPQGAFGGGSPAWTAENRWGTSGSVSRLTGQADGPEGWITGYARRTSGSGDAALRPGMNLSHNPDVATGTDAYPILPNTEYTISLYVRSSRESTHRLRCACYREDGSRIVPLVDVDSETIPANTWTRVHTTLTTPPDAVQIAAYVRQFGVSGDNPVGTTYDATGIMFNEGPLIDYFDGARPDVTGYSDEIDGPEHSPVQFAGDLPADMPIKIWYSTNDPLAVPSTATAFVDARPQTEIESLGAVGHAVPPYQAFVKKLTRWVVQHS